MKVWDLKRTVFSAADFIGWMETGQLELSPSFQRRAVWTKPAKSFFIDTLARGLPVPILFIREKTNVKTLKTIREIVDGQQRLRTVISFVRPSALQDFDKEKDSFTILKSHSAEFAGATFEALPDKAKHRILSYQFSVNVLPPDTADADVLQIFARMNATGTKLNDQELRNAEFFGEFKASVYEKSVEQLDRWRKWGLFSENNIARMEEAELTSQLYILILEGLFGKTPAHITKYYKDNEDAFPQRRAVEYRFAEVMDKIESTIGTDIAATVFSRKTLFFTLFAVFYDLMFGLKKDVEKTKPAVKPKQVPNTIKNVLKTVHTKLESGTAPQRVQDAAARRTTHKSNREALHKYCMNML